MFLEARHKLGISITNDKLWHPLMDPHVENNLAKSKVIVIVLVGLFLPTWIIDQLPRKWHPSIPFK